MKQYSYNELLKFVYRADTPEKLDTAEKFIKSRPYLTQIETDELVDLINSIRYDEFWKCDEPCPWDVDEDRGSYSPSAPWNAPGMQVSDFITGVVY